MPKIQLERVLNSILIDKLLKNYYQHEAVPYHSQYKFTSIL